MYKLGANRINLWDEPFMQKQDMTMELKVLYLYLLSNALSNIAGVYKITDRRILFDLCNPNLNLPALFLQLKKMKKVYRCKDYVIVKDAPLYIKKMTKTVIKEMDSIIYELPDKIKTKMKKIHYRYAHLYGEPVVNFAYRQNAPCENSHKCEFSNRNGVSYEELMVLGKENKKKMGSCSLPKNKDMNERLFDGTFIQGREHEKSKNNHQNDEASLFNSSGVFQGVETTKTNTADEQNNSEARSFITKEATRKNVRVENKPRIEAFSSIQTPPVETPPVEITPAIEPSLEEETAELEQQKPEASSVLEDETAEPNSEPIAELEDHYTDEALTEKLTTENLTEEDKQIIKRIRESDAFYSNFAKDAREFAAKQRRLEILENMHNMQRANKLPSPPVKTLRVDEASQGVETPLNEGEGDKPSLSVKPSVSVETVTQPSPSVQTPTVDKTPPITQTPPIDAPLVKTPSIAKTLSESHTESYTGELGLTFGQNYKTPSQNSKGQEIGLIQRNVNTKTLSNQNANNAKRRQEVERFQEKYAQSVYKQFQKAGLYQGIDYLYFYKCDFKRGLKTLQERAITVEDLKDAYSLNEVIEAYLEKAKAEKDERVRCTMAFYKMCDAREYNTLNVVNY